jgi:two-component system, NtrC family, response regulator GlrR
MMQAKILIVDDDPGMCSLLHLRLAAAGYQVSVAQEAGEAVARAREEGYDLALVSVTLEDAQGRSVLERLLRTQPALPLLLLGPPGSLSPTSVAPPYSPAAFLLNPCDPHTLLHRVEKTLAVRRYKEQVERLRTLMEHRAHFNTLIVASAQMYHVLSQVIQLAATDSTVCLSGESGTGKELIARAIHVASPRAPGPFTPLNCGAIPEGLLENELFGHTKGAYTGADQAKRGLLQQAEGGTLFLDEIGELPAPLQVKLLRVLQEREFSPLGAGPSIKLNIRLVAATNHDLMKLVVAGKFRADLYYRISVIPLLLPPLRERPEDIVVLALHFLQHFSRALQKEIRGFAPATLHQLLLHDWPGNVRELANVVERAVVLAPTSLITADLLHLGSQTYQSAQPRLLPWREARRQFEKGYLAQVLTLVKGNISRAAELAERDRAEFYRLLRKHEMDPDAYRGAHIPV